MISKAQIEEAQSVIDFISQSPSSFHAVDNIARLLISGDYQELHMHEEWSLEPNGRYFVRYNGTAIIAFSIPSDGAEALVRDGFRMIASHSDSPTFRVKPNGVNVCTAVRLSTETYGGAILYSWLDRPLGLAGRVLLKSGDSLRPEQRCVDFERPVGVIPSVAIHFNRGVNDGVSFNKQIDMQILAGSGNGDIYTDCLAGEIAKLLDVDKANILDYDLYAYDTTPGCIAGLDNSLVLCPKQDNLTMAYESVMALLDNVDGDSAKMVLVLDNEEVGSGPNKVQILSSLLTSSAGFVASWVWMRRLTSGRFTIPFSCRLTWPMLPTLTTLNSLTL